MDGIFCTWRQGCTNRCSLAAGLREKWRGNEEMRRKWRKNEEMERDWLSTFPHSLSISSLFLHFLPLFPFPTSKCITFCCKMLNTALLSRMSQKSQHTRYEEIILGRTCCEEAPQFVPAWMVVVAVLLVMKICCDMITSTQLVFLTTPRAAPAQTIIWRQCFFFNVFSSFNFITAYTSLYLPCKHSWY